ncbi:unnamed protein product [Ectocarpus fasciculatus]
MAFPHDASACLPCRPLGKRLKTWPKVGLSGGRSPDTCKEAQRSVQPEILALPPGCCLQLHRFIRAGSTPRSSIRPLFVQPWEPPPPKTVDFQENRGKKTVQQQYRSTQPAPSPVSVNHTPKPAAACGSKTAAKVANQPETKKCRKTIVLLLVPTALSTTGLTSPRDCRPRGTVPGSGTATGGGVILWLAALVATNPCGACCRRRCRNTRGEHKHASCAPPQAAPNCRAGEEHFPQDACTKKYHAWCSHPPPNACEYPQHLGPFCRLAMPHNPTPPISTNTQQQSNNTSKL